MFMYGFEADSARCAFTSRAEIACRVRRLHCSNVQESLVHIGPVNTEAGLVLFHHRIIPLYRVADELHLPLGAAAFLPIPQDSNVSRIILFTGDTGVGPHSEDHELFLLGHRDPAAETWKGQRIGEASNREDCKAFMSVQFQLRSLGLCDLLERGLKNPQALLFLYQLLSLAL